MLKRKFYRLSCLSDIFKIKDNIFETSVDGTGGFTDSFYQEYKDKIDEHTLLYITATEEDTGKTIKLNSEYNGKTTVLTHVLRACDTLIWVRGKVYCISTKTVISVVFNEKKSTLDVHYSDGTSESIKISTSQGGSTYTAGKNVTISNDNVISVFGFYSDERNNFVENPDVNYALKSVSGSHVEGYHNISNTDYQHVSGKYAKLDSDKIFIVGFGTDDDHRDNLFTISKMGVVYVKNDVTCSGFSDEEPDYRLQDIHSCLDEDWVIIGSDDNSFKDDNFNNSYK